MARGRIIRRGSQGVSNYEHQLLEQRPVSTGGEARPDPEELLARAQEDAERLAKEAYEMGFQQGQQDGRAEFLGRAANAANMLRQASHAMRTAHQEFLDALGPQAAALALKIAARILQREARTDAELVLRTARSALDLMADKAHVILRVNPEDLAILREHRAALLEEFEGAEHIGIEVDNEIARGGCVAESGTLVVDATLEAQLDRLLDAMKD